MEIFVLGCGTILKNPGDHGNCSGYLLDQTHLFDCGPGVWRAIYEYRMDMLKINRIFLSHFHPDHVSDLDAILLNRLLLRDQLPSPLQLSGPPGLVAWYEQLVKINGEWITKVPVRLIELTGKPHVDGGYSILTHPTGHTENSISYRIEKDGRSCFYSGDCGNSGGVTAFAAGANLALIEASHPDETPIEGHLTPSLAAKMAIKAKIERLVLTHLYPQTRTADPLPRAKTVFGDNVLLAHEGMRIPV